MQTKRTKMFNLQHSVLRSFCIGTRSQRKLGKYTSM